MPNRTLARTRNAGVPSTRDHQAPDAAPSRDALKFLQYGPTVLAVPAVGLGVAGLLGSGPAFLRRHPVVSAVLACGGMVALFKSQFDRFLLEQPHFELEGEVDGLELRRYPPRRVAETHVEVASFDEARKEAFSRLARYIFGDNTAREKLSASGRVDMTRQKSEPHGEHLPMTTPVTLAHDKGGYVMRFQLPKDRTLSSLPRPNDYRVRLRQVPTERVAVLRFRGTYSEEHIAAKERELLSRVRAAGFSPTGEPIFAGYDAPTALPFLRRIEVWVPIA